MGTLRKVKKAAEQHLRDSRCLSIFCSENYKLCVTARGEIGEYCLDCRSIKKFPQALLEPALCFISVDF